MFMKRQIIDVSHLAAYAEDPQSYCHFRGKPRSLHDKKTRKKKAPLRPLRSQLSHILLGMAVLSLLISGWCLWNLLG